ncbi:hypothetical protein GGTG_03603 [Gaeumannomyces tritici R3-111a-1]|uniref:C2H2-type domain-containing protein n=1 Tax=Gaeumannomyces tritici (strain R3-111a-1) TaxID=644352 RepID=J3NQP7_GAET3|nr:hypothetical protein GGTG_03603 [Gaeumannomyces tritici R3-111a-1]EJT78503.1 hypothetical protein GGTG_03603 [Gaeumannomyces tritici R3-111a-1]
MERIKSLPRGVAHTVLLAICNDPSTLRRAIDLVDLVEAPQSPVDGGDDDDDDGYDEDEVEVEIVGVAPMPNRKRKISSSDGVTIRAADLFSCDVCEKPFLASRNRHNACKYHEGELEPDLECGLWDDHVENPDVWGDIDTRENIREHPEGFYWDCCGKRADDSGCQADYHTSADFSGSSVAKRSRLDGSADGGQAAYANDPIDVRDDGDDDDSVVEVAAPLVTIDDDIDEDPPEELEEETGFGARIVNGEVVVEVALHQEAKPAVAVSDNDSLKAGGEV